jgi:hypothetical protein
VHIDEIVNVNAALPNAGNAGRQLYPNLQTDLAMYTPFGDVTYHGLQSRLRKRIGAASFVAVSYTFSKAINTGSDNNDGGLFRNYPLSYRLNKALAGFDRTQALNVSYVYQLPFGYGHRLVNHGWASWIVGGWQLSSTLTRASGVPFTVNTSSNLNGPGQGNSANQISPNVAILGGHDPTHPYFDGSAFANPPNGVLGSTGRNILRGPGLFNMNGSVSRIFAFKEERIKFQLVGEAFNLTNTVTFSNPNSTCCWVTNATTGALNFNGFAVIGNQQSIPRYLQVGGYLRF